VRLPGTPAPPGRRWIIASSVTAILLGLVFAGKVVFLHAIDREWPAIRDGVDSTLAASIARELHAYYQTQESSFQRLRAIPAFRVLLTATNRSQRAAALRDVLDASRSDGTAFELRTADGKLAAYAGRPIPGRRDVDRAGAASSIISEGLFTFLLLEGAIDDRAGRSIGRLRTAAPLLVRAPASNRYFDDRSLSAALEESTGAEVMLEFGSGSPLARDGRYLPIPIVFGAQRVGHAYTLRTNPVEYRHKVGRHFDAATAFLLAALTAILSLFLCVRVLRNLPAMTRLFSMILLLCAVRAVLFISNAGTHLLPDALLNPAVFASSFGGGIASSIGELTISLLFVFASVVAAVRALRRGSEDGLFSRSVSIASLLFIPLSLPVLVRGYAASMQSFVTDSAFNFDDVVPLLSDPALLLMLFDVFLLSASAILAVLALQHVLRRALRGSGMSGRVSIAYGIAAVGIPLLLFAALTRALLLPLWLYGGISAAVLAAAHPWLRVTTLGRWSAGTMFLAVWLAATVSAASLLHHFMHLRRLGEVDIIAEQLARPIDGWSSALASQAAQQLALVTIAGEGPHDAFSLWSASLLSSQPNNSAVILYDAAGRERSRFVAGIDPRDLDSARLRALLDLPPDSVAAFRQRSDVPRGSLYATRAALPGPSGGSGTIVTIVESLDPLTVTQQRVDLLRSAPVARSLAPEDRYAVSVFRNGVLVASSDPDLPRGAHLPSDIADSMRGRAESRWSVLETGRGELPSLFVRPAADSATSILCVSTGEQVFLFTVYRWFRIGLIFLAILLAMSATVYLRSGLFRRMRRLPFSSRVRLSLLAVASIPLLLVWTSARRFVADSNERLVQQQLRESMVTLRANLRMRTGPGNRGTSATDADCFTLTERTGREVNVYTGTELTASSRPELYSAGLLYGRLHPDAYLAIALRGREFRIVRERIGEFEYFVGYLGIRDEAGAFVGAISTPTLFEKNRAEEATIRASAVMFLGTGFIALLVLAVSAALARQISKPLRELTAATKDIAAGDLEKRVRLSASPEIDALVRSFNTMTEQLYISRRELASAERDLAWKEMAKQVAHEIRNPLTPMRLAAQHLKRAADDNAPDLRELITKMSDVIIDRIDTLTRISEEFSRFARMPRRTPGDVNAGTLLAECAALFRHHEQIDFALEIAEELPLVHADREELSRALTNIVRNAVQAIPLHGTIRLQASGTPSAVTIAISDTGTGIPRELLPRIFEPNFSTKTEGMGLGLAIVKKIIDDVHGTISIDSETGTGTTVRIVLPAAR
jgi:two-component system, NtrC family, nitrogen regulation sensor histidine kinase NtrY